MYSRLSSPRRQPTGLAAKARPAAFFGSSFANFGTITQGVPGFFLSQSARSVGTPYTGRHRTGGIYTTAPLERTLKELVDFDHLNNNSTRLTVGAVSVRTGEMRYFDSRDMILGPEHVMASGALPPGFPAIRVDREPYWDGGLYSNTPVEVVFDDKPRRSSLIFSVNMWQPYGFEPETIWQVLGRQKDIQYGKPRPQPCRTAGADPPPAACEFASSASGCPRRRATTPKELTAFGCHTTMHLVRLLSPRLAREDHTKDIDFSRAGITTRWRAGYEHARRVLAEKPWECDVDTLTRIVVHESTDRQFAISRADRSDQADRVHRSAKPLD